ncbi:MAG: glycosyltransferase [Anaerolineae bacterium]
MTHILFLMSDTGGGHRAACRAIQAALDILYPNQFTYAMVDVWKDYYPYPFNTMPQTYSKWVNWSPTTYEAQFWVNDRIFRLRTVSSAYVRRMYRPMHRLLKEHPHDMIVCVHSVFVRPMIYTLRRDGRTTPFVTVITDYALPTVLWYDPRVEKTLVPTEAAFQRGLRLKVPAERMVLTGAPVHPKFSQLKLTKAEARAALDWDQDALIVLMIGGGDGMGPLVATAKAVDEKPIHAQLVIIAGKNEALKRTLESRTWRHPTKVYGFVNNLEVFMRAADLLITKAGPATMTEAALMGLPMVISGAIRFQESPNVEYMVAQGAGVYAPGPRRVAAVVESILANNAAQLHKLAEGVTRIAQPDAIWNIAREIYASAPKSE